MRVYYNEVDKRAAAWLRELIERKVIADGEVDTRSIVDVQAADLAGFRQCHFFAGIGGWSYALRLAGWADDRECWTGSCPCQPFSVAGGGTGSADPRHLWPSWFRLIGERRPSTIFGEQVASRDGLYWLDLVFADLEAIDYAIGAFDLPAAGAGAPHGRQRLWIVADDNREGRDRIEAARLHERRSGTVGDQPTPGDADGARGDDINGCGAAGELADAVRDGTREHTGELSRDESEHAERTADGDHRVRDGGTVGRLDDANRRRRRSRRGVWTEQARPNEVTGADAERDGDMGIAASEGPQGGTVEGTAGPRDEGSAPERAGASSVWSACDWIPCIDGKARPVEPGTFPLAHGVSARVGRLRGYGNAIVAPLAAEVIRAYMEVRS